MVKNLCCCNWKRLIVVFLLIFFPLLTLDLSASEQINSFDVDVYIPNNGVVRIEENIEYQFPDEVRRGIIRKIPYKYKLGQNNYNLRIEVLNVTDFDGNSYKYNVKENNGYVEIKIGDPDKFVTGVHGYNIEYFVKKAIREFDDYDEFYWNVTGTEWDIPILSSSAHIYFEAEIPDELKLDCFTGKYGSTEKNCTYNSSKDSVVYSSNGELNPYQGLTIVLGFPEGLVKGHSKLDLWYWFIRDNLIYSVPFLTLFGLFLVWYKFGRDPYKDMPIAVRYSPPPDLTPAEAGTLYDEKADMIDLTSTVIDLAVRGYLRIEEIESTKYFFLSDKDYKLIKTVEKKTDDLMPHEIKILEGLFSSDQTDVLISDLKNKFYLNLKSIKNSIYSQLVDKSYFLSNPDRIRATYKALGWIIIFSSLFILPSLIPKLIFALSGLFIVVFSRFMPRKTKKGVTVNHHLLGFREFIDRAEKDRIKALADEDPSIFDRVLPYALVFGLEDKWAEAFSDMFTEPPDWYTSSGYSTSYSPYILVNDLGRSISIMNKSFYSSPKNSSGGRSISMGGGSGGGSSGGGFGGGGGGSW